MATRTYHSSPCFLRVAEARAASSASKMTSLSTPFSFETASTTIRISLFISYSSSLCARRPLSQRGQSRLRNLAKWHIHALPVDLEGHSSRGHFLQHSRVAAPSVAWRNQFNQHPRALEPLVVRVGTQHSIVARR